ncbi:tetratricopeptide repeat protein [Mesorhizobium sp. AA23]|uniref:tetratricopeptide repeat protein n=1 Tax=Mesorhizobium sp. AA23 TaxID=1854058 RepID=UPI0018D4B59A|nr:tetratricopeptide repeat protein [Mesorhizobium sp. AA23]
MAWLRKGDNDRAAADYDEDIALDPTDASAFNWRGFVWASKGDYDRGIADFDRAIEIYGKNAGFFYNRAKSWTAKGNYEKAIADYDQAIGLDPNFANAYRGRGLVHFYAGALSDAQYDFRRLAALKPDDPYSAIWRDLAERHAGGQSELRAATGKLDMTKWPAPVARMLLGDLAPAEVLAAADDPNPQTRQGQVCDANFYTAELSRLQGHSDEAVRLYRLAVSDCPKSFVEYRGATMALKALYALP